MSFMAAIFAINTNGFPLDSEDRIPFDYLMKYLGEPVTHPSHIAGSNVINSVYRARLVHPLHLRRLQRRHHSRVAAVPSRKVRRAHRKGRAPDCPRHSCTTGRLPTSRNVVPLSGHQGCSLNLHHSHRGNNYLHEAHSISIPLDVFEAFPQ